ncbi:MAG: thymidine phosphorylase [Myxococcota bacterium]
MRAAELIRRVRDREALDPTDIQAFVRDIASGALPDYQATAFLMAVYLQGLGQAETVALTLAMRDSGQVIDLSKVAGTKVDKHSTGGVGDKISIPLAPLVAACGVRVPMVSGRGLGHTGGTLDKLESIPGFRVDLDIPTFRRLVDEIGVCLIGQTKDLAPADRKLYALRDVTATVESVPLITSSILSKKLAEGIDALVLDVKVGRGAFMKDETSARTLAESLVRVGTGAGVKVRALLTRMEEPLGTTVGNALEIAESIAILKGEGPADTTELTFALGAEMMLLAGVAPDKAAARAKMQQAVDSGAALDKLRQIIAAQHGDPRVVDDLARLPQAQHRTPVPSPTSGFVQAIDAYALGIAAMRLGAGRARAEDTIDPAVGVELVRKVGSEVRAGEPLALVHHNGSADAAVHKVQESYRIGAESPAPAPLVLDVLE